MDYDHHLWHDVARLSAHFHQTHLPTIRANKWPQNRDGFLDVLICARDISAALSRYETVFLTDADPRPAGGTRTWSPLRLQAVSTMLQFEAGGEYEPVVFVNAAWGVGNLCKVVGVVAAIWQDASGRLPFRELETTDLYVEICEMGELLLEALLRA